MIGQAVRIQKEWKLLREVSYQGVFYYTMKGTDLYYY
jgi:hypothetical protein